MYVELTTGKDTFRPQTERGGLHRSSLRRNVSINLYVCPPGYPQFEPVYQAFKRKIKGLGTNQLQSVHEATSRVPGESVGRWYNTRYEVAPGTMFVVEHVLMSTNPARPFDRDTTYMLLIADETAPLMNIACDLPEHFLADINTVFFKGRMHVVYDAAHLSTMVDSLALNAVRTMFNLDPHEDEELVDYIGEATVREVFAAQVLEKGAAPAMKVVKTGTVVKGTKTSVQLRRVRRIKT